MMSNPIQETPQQRRYRVLNTIYDITNGDPSVMPLYTEIETATQIDSNTITGILRYLDEKNLIHMGGEWLNITSLGIDQIERTRNYPEQATPYFPANIFYNTFNAPVTGVQQGGQHNTQSNIQNINPDFKEAIKQIFIALDKSSVLTPVQKIKIKADVQTVNELANLEKTPEVIQEADTKIGAIQSVLSTTADLVSLGMVVIPIFRAFFGL